MIINSKGFWENPTSEGHYNDEVLLNELKKIINKNQINNLVDLGCGNGYYASNFKDILYNMECFDGNPYTNEITNGLCNVLDFSKPFDLNKTFDCVMSLEVGEHIPKQFESIFLDNVSKHSHNIILLSWAIPNQPGDGHVNCQENEYIINEMGKRGFIYDNDESQQVRKNNVVWWFKDTFMFFKKIN
jgi:cyclopropane fatty-acyl-phospholipid synthase-like methyltransferase